MNTLPSLDDLVPPTELIIDGTGTREVFAARPPTFLQNVLIPRCRLKPEHAILDIGFGNGRHARHLTRFLKPEGRYVGFDIVPGPVEWCQRAYAPFANFHFDLARIRSDWYAPHETTRAEDYVFPYEADTFDVAIATSLFTHLEPAASANYLKQTARVLRPGGCFAFSAYLWRDHAPQRDDIQGCRFTRASPAHHVLDHSKPSRGIAHDFDNMQAMVRDAGLVLSEIYFGRWAHPIDQMGNAQDLMIAVKP